MSQSSPLVSVAIPTYNSARTLERALESLASQDYENIELIIFDDCSADNSFEICQALKKKYQSRFVNFLLEKNQTNLGVYNNLRRHIEFSKGKYFSWCCPDDYWDESFLSRQVEILEESNDVSAVFTAAEYFLDSNNSFSIRIPPEQAPEKNTQSFAVRMCLSTAGHCYGLDKNMYFVVIHGLVKKDIFLDSLECLPEAIHSERQVVSIWALAGRFRYIDEILYFKETPQHFTEKVSKEIMSKALEGRSIRKYYEEKQNKQKNRIKRYSLRKYYMNWLPSVFRSRKVNLKYKILSILILTRHAIQKRLSI